MGGAGKYSKVHLASLYDKMMSVEHQIASFESKREANIVVRDLKNALRKLSMSKRQRMVAGNQLLQKEKEALIITIAVVVTSLLIAGGLLITHTF